VTDVIRKSLIRYGSAVLMVGLALIVTTRVTLLQSRIPFALFYIAVVVSVLFGGRGPGLIATLLSALGVTYFIFLPSYSSPISKETVILVSVFVFVSLVISWMMERTRRAEIAAVQTNTQLTGTLEKIRFHANLLDVVEQAVIATDMSGKITYWNRYAEKLYGWSAEEALGRDVVQTIPTDMSREQADGIMSLLREGKSWSGDFLAQRRDGTVIPIRVLDTPIFDESGNQKGMVGISEDISKRIRADREKARLTLAIEEQRLRLDNIVASVPGVVWEAWGKPDADSQSIDFVSDYVETMLGYSVDEWLSSPNFWLTIVHDEDKERAANEAAAIFAKGSGTSQFRWLTKDGRALWVEAQSVVIYDDDGNPLGMRGVTMDITERVRAGEMQSRLAAIVESTDVAIVGKTLDGVVTSWNKGAERIYGYSAEEMLGSSIQKLVPQDRVTELISVFDRLESAQQIEQYETVRIRKDGTRVDVAVTISPIRNPNGAVIGASTITHDITQRKLVEQKQAELLALEQTARSQAESANRTKDEFLATLSHELRTPLTAILGWTWMLRYRSLDDETFMRAVETIDRNVNMQAHLVDDLLDVSRIITGNLRLDVSPTDLVAVVEAAIDTVRPAAMAKEIQLIIELDQSAKNVDCDPARMQQVAWNLLSNAVKFTPKNGIVRVELKRSKDHVEICVIDNGRGISADFLPFVFDRFRQADSSTTRTHGGLGLGLAIVRHLVELHGGTVRVESDGPEKGARFTVSLPLIRGNPLPNES